MIAEFTIENYRSFKERRTFSLIATKDKELPENTFDAGKKLRFLKSAVIYGANASGKSSFFNALVFFLDFSVYSSPRKQIKESIGVEPFLLSRQTESAPSSFEIIFILKNDYEETRYRYGFTVNNKEVLSEYLFAVYGVREVMLFSRNHQEIECTTHFKEGIRIKPSVRSNGSFLSVCSQNNGKISSEIVMYFLRMGVIYGQNEIAFPQTDNTHPAYRKKIINFLKYADIQVTGFKTEPLPIYGSFFDSDLPTTMKSKLPSDIFERVLFAHTLYDNETPVDEKYLDETVESAGTRKLFHYSGYILDALEQGTPLFIDEFDSQLHPLIIEKIIERFNSPTDNPKNAQLIISSHAVNIMTNKLLRRDQIWFCEKDLYGATNLFSLVEYKEPVRKDSSYNKNYLRGKYGAIPSINELFLQRD